MSLEMPHRLRALPALAGTPLGIDTAALPNEPLALFDAWLASAVEAGVAEAHAMTVATLDADGIPDARTLLLKRFGEAGWEFAGPASSRKGQQVAAHPVAALSFWWQPLVRAVRIRGEVVEASREDSEADLAARSPEAQRDVAPGDWRLWRVQPVRVEFWEGSTDRRHTRVVYERASEAWTLTVLQGEERVLPAK